MCFHLTASFFLFHAEKKEAKKTALRKNGSAVFEAAMRRVISSPVSVASGRRSDDMMK